MSDLTSMYLESAPWMDVFPITAMHVHRDFSVFFVYFRRYYTVYNSRQLGYSEFTWSGRDGGILCSDQKKQYDHDKRSHYEQKTPKKQNRNSETPIHVYAK